MFTLENGNIYTLSNEHVCLETEPHTLRNGNIYTQKATYTLRNDHNALRNEHMHLEPEPLVKDRARVEKVHTHIKNPPPSFPARENGVGPDPHPRRELLKCQSQPLRELLA